MKNAEIHELTTEELAKNLEDVQKELLNLKIQARTGQLENTARIRTLRRDVARFKTEKNLRLRTQSDPGGEA